MTRPHDEALVEAVASELMRHHIHKLLGRGKFSCSCGEVFIEYAGTSTEAHRRHLARAALSAMEAASETKTIYSVQPWIDVDGVHDGWQTGYGHFTHARTDAEVQMAHESREPNAPELRLAQAQITPWRPVEQEARPAESQPVGQPIRRPDGQAGR